MTHLHADFEPSFRSKPAAARSRGQTTGSSCSAARRCGASPEASFLLMGLPIAIPDPIPRCPSATTQDPKMPSAASTAAKTTQNMSRRKNPYSSRGFTGDPAPAPKRSRTEASRRETAQDAKSSNSSAESG